MEWQARDLLRGGRQFARCLNARTGEPIWRVPTAKSGAKGGVNAAVLVYNDTLITVHESENLDSSEVGRMAAFKIPPERHADEPERTRGLRSEATRSVAQ